MTRRYTYSVDYRGDDLVFSVLGPDRDVVHELLYPKEKIDRLYGGYVLLGVSGMADEPGDGESIRSMHERAHEIVRALNSPGRAREAMKLELGLVQ